MQYCTLAYSKKRGEKNLGDLVEKYI